MEASSSWNITFQECAHTISADTQMDLLDAAEGYLCACERTHCCSHQRIFWQNLGHQSHYCQYYINKIIIYIYVDKHISQHNYGVPMVLKQTSSPCSILYVHVLVYSWANGTKYNWMIRGNGNENKQHMLNSNNIRSIWRAAMNCGSIRPRISERSSSSTEEMKSNYKNRWSNKNQ